MPEVPTARSLAVAANVAFIFAVLVILGVFLFRELGPNPEPPRTEPPMRQIGAASSYAEDGHWIGSKDAPVVIVEFADFECPVCRTFALGPLREVQDQFGDSIAVVFRHLPIPTHRLAYHTARAAECAAQQGKFAAFHDAIFEGQDSLGIRPLASFATEAEITDSAAFSDCLSRPGPVAAIERDLATAQKLGLSGTPSLIIGDTLVTGTLDRKRLVKMIQGALR